MARISVTRPDKIAVDPWHFFSHNHLFTLHHCVELNLPKKTLSISQFYLYFFRHSIYFCNIQVFVSPFWPLWNWEQEYVHCIKEVIRELNSLLYTITLVVYASSSSEQAWHNGHFPFDISSFEPLSRVQVLVQAINKVLVQGGSSMPGSTLLNPNGTKMLATSSIGSHVDRTTRGRTERSQITRRM